MKVNPMTLLQDGKYKSTIRAQVIRYSRTWNVHGIPLPTEELYSAANEICARALETYDPVHGASFPTWLHHQLGRLRDVAQQEQKRILFNADGFKVFRDQGDVQTMEDQMGDSFRVDRNLAPIYQTIRALMAGVQHYAETEDELFLDDLSSDGRGLVEVLLERGIRRGARPTPESIRRSLKWTRTRAEDAWEEVGVWLRHGGKAFPRVEAWKGASA